MNPLRCQDTANAASPRLDGELGVAQRLWLRAHLFFCRNCRDFHSQIEQTVELTRKSAPPALTEDRRQALLERFRAGE